MSEIMNCAYCGQIISASHASIERPVYCSECVDELGLEHSDDYDEDYDRIDDCDDFVEALRNTNY